MMRDRFGPRISLTNKGASRPLALRSPRRTGRTVSVLKVPGAKGRLRLHRPEIIRRLRRQAAIHRHLLRHSKVRVSNPGQRLFRRPPPALPWDTGENDPAALKGAAGNGLSPVRIWFFLVATSRKMSRRCLPSPTYCSAMALIKCSSSSGV